MFCVEFFMFIRRVLSKGLYFLSCVKVYCFFYVFIELLFEVVYLVCISDCFLFLKLLYKSVSF